MDLIERVSTVEQTIFTVKNRQSRRDLLKMLAHIDSIMNEISKEAVQCRRLHKNTPKFEELQQKVHNLLDNLEQHITFACLLG